MAAALGTSALQRAVEAVESLDLDGTLVPQPTVSQKFYVRTEIDVSDHKPVSSLFHVKAGQGGAGQATRPCPPSRAKESIILGGRCKQPPTHVADKEIVAAAARAKWIEILTQRWNTDKRDKGCRGTFHDMI